MPEPEQRATADRIRDFLATQPATSGGDFTLPMLTGVLRTHRR
ncbi:hypothetical protein ACFQZ4_08570 [Catellatospora coxensis]